MHGEGNSLGMWAPVVGISTVTVEIPHGDIKARKRIHDLMLTMMFYKMFFG